ncbi:hypothetical protein SKAU_G00125900 [Synaphobranchus kaupii]|uniref:PHD-type domain-containing protein n=1 Tax=Synaphobranchus kaupii TaxID=118154 RepID=A0A9Q1FPN9_SYNKA|nr:hypothetical protein SKAU_G00125900 [Synaphobranchus kaupii]
MEPPPSGQSGSLHPQDRIPCSLTTVFDLTRKSEESLLKTNSMDTLHVVKAPSWYSINPVTNKGLVFPENDSDHTPLPSEQIQPDDAFSNTTVTLSYVSRSHVFSSQDSLSQLHPLCGVQSISRKLSRHTSSFEPDAMLTEAGRGGLCVEVGQGFLSHAARPVGLAPETTLFETEEQAHLIESITGSHLVPQAIEVNGKQAASLWGVDNIELGNGESPKKCISSHEKDKVSCVQNGMGSDPWILGSHEEKSSDCLITGTEGVQKKCDSEVLLLISRTDDPVFLQDNRGPRNFLLNGDYVNPLEDPLSPSTTSVDDMEDVFILPQTLSSPSGENSFTDEAANTTGENPVEGEPSSDLSVTESTLTSVVGASSQQSSCSDEDVIEMPVDRNGIHHTVPSAVPKSYVESETGDGVSQCKGRISVTQKKVRTPDLPNGNTQEDAGRFERKKLPPRSTRGMRLEAIVQNITPSRYKVTSSAHSAKKHCGPKTRTNETHLASVGRGILNSVGSQNHKEKADGPEKPPTVKTASLQEDIGNIYPDHCSSNKSTSGSEHASISKPKHCSTSPKASKPPDSDVKEMGKGQSRSSPAKCSPGQARPRALPVPKVCPKSPAKQLRASTSSKSTHTAKRTHNAKKKRKKCKGGQSSMFFPKEPEIKLKYVNYKEEKRDKSEAFSPFVRLEAKEYSTCTVINYPEEENVRLKKGQQQVCAGFISGTVPSTSCLQLGRLSTESKRQSSLVCCLCGWSANSMDLGDLHGPYYPDNFKPALKAHLSLQGLKAEEDDDSDSDSLCSMPGGKRSRAAGPWPKRPCHRLKREAVLGACRKWGSDGDRSQSPLAKKPRTESAADDWYSPPVVPLDTSEYWVHEDCGIWSAGVFLVKGKLYGLEEAVRLAKETVCSTCHAVGATLGCLFKGCSNKYHYACAVQSDCVLNEDNFSMKCTKHKNKSVRASSVNRRDNR